MKKVFVFIMTMVMMINVVGIKADAMTLEENKIIDGDYVRITTVRVFEVKEVDYNGFVISLHFIEDHTYEQEVNYIPSGYIFSSVCGYGPCYHNDKEIGDCSEVGNIILEVNTYIMEK